MPARALTHPLNELKESDLARLARVADPLLAGRPLAGAGRHPQRLRSGSGYEFLEYRNYATGEDLRNIDWRATARARYPQLRRYRDEQTSDWHICLDCSASMVAPTEHKWRLAVQLSAALGYLLLHLGQRVALLSFSDRCTALLPAGRGRHHYARLARILRETAPVRAGGGTDMLRCAPNIAPRHQVIIVSDFLAQNAMQPALRRLAAAHTVHAMHIVDESEFAMAATAYPMELCDIESHERRSLTPNNEIAALAQRALFVLRDDLSTYCRDRGIRYTVCNTDAHWASVVLQYLKGFVAAHV